MEWKEYSVDGGDLETRTPSDGKNCKEQTFYMPSENRAYGGVNVTTVLSNSTANTLQFLAQTAI